MHPKTILFLLFISLIFPLFSDTAVVFAGNPYINIPYEQYKADEARRHWWNSLSEREKYLVKTISRIEDDYHDRTGHYIPVNQANVGKMMSIIHADNSDAAFVLKRMRFYLEVDETSRKADKLMDTILHDKRIWGY